MKKKYKINFLESSSPIAEAVTKFGGQPVWIEKPEWAVSRSTGKPMMFIGQIRVEDEEEPGFENKVGGYPNFLQAEEYPDENVENWNLLLQLDSGSTPFDINFGDVGIGYAFISKDGKTGKFLWQCG